MAPRWGASAGLEIALAAGSARSGRYVLVRIRSGFARGSFEESVRREHIALSFVDGSPQRRRRPNRQPSRSSGQAPIAWTGRSRWCDPAEWRVPPGAEARCSSTFRHTGSARRNSTYVPIYDRRWPAERPGSAQKGRASLPPNWPPAGKGPNIELVGLRSSSH